MADNEKIPESGEPDEDLQDESDSSSEPTQGSRDKAKPFFVVGIGASAGGLESLERLFARVPEEPNMAFVVIIHLLPDHISLLPELIQRSTKLPVAQITDGMPLLKNRVYTIPPDFKVSIVDGTFRLAKAERTIPLTQIDLFFRSLAQEYGEFAVAVILSGAGSDGTAGIRAIKERMGVTIAEDPDLARYSSMPEQAINTGLVDRVLPAEEIPQLLSSLVNDHGALQTKISADDQSTEWILRRIFFNLRSRTGHDFTGYKRNTILRRIQRRMYLHQIETLSGYAEFLQESPGETVSLFKELLIGVTRFFREPECFEILKTRVFPEIIAAKPNGGSVRVWTPGVATGEEAYSIAILLQELRDSSSKDFKVQIFATDIDPDAIDFARAGLFPASIAEDVSPEIMKKYFDREGDKYRVRRLIRETVVFAEQNVIKDPPFTRLDLISCRNLLIYLNSELQQRLMPLFHYSLRPSGYLVLGTSESVGQFSGLFRTIDAKWKIFAVRDGAEVHQSTFDIQFSHPRTERQPLPRPLQEDFNVVRQTNRVLLDRFAPPSVVINAKGEVLYIHGRTGRYLEPAPGQQNQNIFDMARTGLNLQLPQLIREATQAGREVTRRNIPVKVNGDEVEVDVTARPLGGKNREDHLMMIIFQEVVPTSAEPAETPEVVRDEPYRALEAELKYTKGNLQTVIEELETSNEELRSTNEEYQSTNEELKSTNEELETSREELQSLNEELATVNREMQEKMDELSQSHTEITRFLDSLGAPTVFIDNDLRVRRFTSQASELIHLIETDVGRPLSDITYDLEDKELVEDARRVRDSMVYQQREVRTIDGHWYLRRIIPYRSAENVVTGVVINFVDIHELKGKTMALEAIKQKLEYTNLMVQTLRQALVLVDEECRILAANRPFYLLLKIKNDEIEDKSLFEIGRGQLDSTQLRQALERLKNPSEPSDSVDMVLDSPSSGQKEISVYIRRLYVGEKNEVRFLLEIDTVAE